MKDLKPIVQNGTLLTKIKCLSPEQMLDMSRGMPIGNDFVFMKMRIEFKDVIGYWQNSLEDNCTNVMIGGNIFILATPFNSFEKKFLQFKNEMRFIQIIHN